MKLRTKLVISFVTMITIPTILTTAFIFGIARYQIGVIEHTYGITGEEYKDFAKSIRVLGDMPEIQQFYYKRMYRSSPDSGIYSDDHDGVDLWKYHQSDSQVAGSSAERRRRQSEF